MREARLKTDRQTLPYVPIATGLPSFRASLPCIIVHMRSATDGERLSFMTPDDVVTVRHESHARRRDVSTWHQLPLRFYYKPDSQLCRAVHSFSSTVRMHDRLMRHHRRRRQAEFDNQQKVVTKDVVNDVLNGFSRSLTHSDLFIYLFIYSLICLLILSLSD